MGTASSGRKVTSKYTPKKAKAFLKALQEMANVTAAAAAVGLAKSTVYSWRQKHPEFSAEWDSAVEEATAVMEAEAYRRAVHGYTAPVYQGGEYIGDRTVYSDRLLEFILKAYNPQKYRENMGAAEPRQPMQINFYTQSDDSDKSQSD